MPQRKSRGVGVSSPWDGEGTCYCQSFILPCYFSLYPCLPYSPTTIQKLQLVYGVSDLVIIPATVHDMSFFDFCQVCCNAIYLSKCLEFQASSYASLSKTKPVLLTCHSSIYSFNNMEYPWHIRNYIRSLKKNQS